MTWHMCVKLGQCYSFVNLKSAPWKYLQFYLFYYPEAEFTIRNSSAVTEVFAK